MTVTSPCTGICKLDETTGWCLGCGRTGDEIGGWRGLPEMDRNWVWDRIPGRLEQMGVSCRRLSWTTDDIRQFVLRSCESGQGTWVMGVVGAVAEFLVPQGAKIDVTRHDQDVVARTQNGALRMTINDDVRALTFDPPGLKARPRVVLAVKRERGGVPVAGGVVDLGVDRAAVLNEPAMRLYDLGLGRREARFCVRVSQGPAKEALDGVIGLPLAQSLPRMGATLVSQSPTRVVETALGRIEVQGMIPSETGHVPLGPHTHLLPDHIASDRAMPVDMTLPRAYLPGAIFYPKA